VTSTPWSVFDFGKTMRAMGNTLDNTEKIIWIFAPTADLRNNVVCRLPATKILKEKRI
jgi:hypothetical protein